MAKKQSAVEGFLDFIKEQGVVGLAVAVILGTAAKDVVDSLVADVINPLLGLIFDADNLAAETFSVGDAVIGWGSLVSNLISFAVVAAVVYFVLNKAMAKFDKKK
ncbi:TPA: MscL family protein [Candidatus Saccharibacteria bacterium]|nr:MscL family protein [Candidatus Saccharibacteria bacterium]HIO87898.1 MscL family protein [Candidatus Saccharibacteria bacterium]